MNSYVCLPTNFCKYGCVCVSINTAMTFFRKAGISGSAGLKISAEYKVPMALILFHYLLLDLLIWKVKLFLTN